MLLHTVSVSVCHPAFCTHPALRLKGQNIAKKSRHSALRLSATVARLHGAKPAVVIVRAASICFQVEIPEWYTRGHLPPLAEDTQASFSIPVRDSPLHFSVLEGKASVLNECEDSLEFLQLLSDLQRPPSNGEAANELPETKASRGLFRDVSTSIRGLLLCVREADSIPSRG